MEIKKNALDLSEEVLANDTDGIQGHNEKLGRYARAKQHQINIADYILQHEPTLHKEHEALTNCSEYLIFRHWYKLGVYRLIGGCTCKKHLLCAMCALRRSAKTVHEVEKKIRTVLRDRPGLVPVLITMTVKNSESLNERYEHITSSKKKLLHSRRNSLHGKRRVNRSITRLIHGSFGSYEFKKGKNSQDWHPHSHEIALLDSSVEFYTVIKKGKEVECPLEFERALQQEWLRITGDSFIVDVRRVSCRNIEVNDSLLSDDGLLKAICESCKYALKFTDLESSEQVEAYKILRGRRLTFTYGCMWGLKIPEDLNDDVEEQLRIQPYIDLVYQYNFNKYHLTDITDTGDEFFNSSTQKRKENPRIKSSLLLNKYSKAVEEYCSKIGN